MRVLYQNINSLQPQTQDKCILSLTKSRLLQIDILRLTETSENSNQSTLCEQFEQTLNKAYRNNQFPVLSMKSEYTTSYLPRGIVSVITGKWTSRFVEEVKDPAGMGRWNGLKIRAKDNTFPHYITVYRVCLQSINDH
jgi:hypothetical protein